MLTSPHSVRVAVAAIAVALALILGLVASQHGAHAAVRSADGCSEAMGWQGCPPADQQT
jgi:hypothetical protein